MSDSAGDMPDFSAGIGSDMLAEGAAVAGTFDGEAVILIRNKGKVCALAGKCTHLDAPLEQGLLADGAITCPWHHARFSVDTGEAVDAPAFEPLARYDVEEGDGQLRVTGKVEGTTPFPSKTRSPGHVVIIGGGGAGHACAEMLDRAGHGATVTVVTDELDPPYDRTFCSKQYLSGGTGRGDAILARDGFYNLAGRPVLRLARAVIRIDVEAQEVVLTDEERLPYDALVIATGAEPKWSDAPGVDRGNVHLLRTLRDADALVAEIRDSKNAAVIGASFIGLEAAASLRQRGLAVDVIAPEAIPLEPLLGADVGRRIQQVHEEKGVRFHLGRKVTAYDGAELKLDDGSFLAPDFIVLGLGVTPRTALAKDAGLSCASDNEGGGIIVDKRLQTSAEHIYAIGDVARYPDARLGRPIRVEHWVHAQRQGQHVARLLLGLTDRFTATPFFWSAHFDTGLRYLGHASKDAGARFEGSLEKPSFVVHYGSNGEQQAVATCNRDDDALQVNLEWDRAALARLHPTIS